MAPRCAESCAGSGCLRPITGPGLAAVGTYRALAFDPTGAAGAGTFFTANFGGDFFEVDTAGNVLNIFPNRECGTVECLRLRDRPTHWQPAGSTQPPTPASIAEYVIDRGTLTLTDTGRRISVPAQGAQGGLEHNSTLVVSNSPTAHGQSTRQSATSCKMRRTLSALHPCTVCPTSWATTSRSCRRGVNGAPDATVLESVWRRRLGHHQPHGPNERDEWFPDLHRDQHRWHGLRHGRHHLCSVPRHRPLSKNCARTTC